MANNLKDHLKEVADAIRAKKGTSELINPQDFATEIEGISGGGGESAQTIEYYLFAYPNEEFAFDGLELLMASLQALVVAAYYRSTSRTTEYTLSQCLIGGLTLFGEFGFQSTRVKAFKVTYVAGGMSLIDVIGSDNLPLTGLTPCTKEEYEALITE